MGQSTCAISGRVTDSGTNAPVEGVAVSVKGTNIGTLTDDSGNFNFCHMNGKDFILITNYIGYESDTIAIRLLKDTVLNISLRPKTMVLGEVEVSATLKGTTQSRPIEYDKPALSFNKQLALTPGITTMNIGAGISKPVIRGFSTNRVSVINRGVEQQNQQWGADHGIEISQLDVSHTTVYKGPNALLLGSGTITVIDIQPAGFKNKDFFGGKAQLWGASNNNLYGAGISAGWQKDKWFLQGSYEYKDYADYRLPAKDAMYESHTIEFPDKRFPNSAGKDYSISGTLGFREKNVTTYLNVSNGYQKSGLFHTPEDHSGHDHGEEDHDHDHKDDHHHDHDHEVTDASHRNISLPYATANHFAVTNNTEWTTSAFRLLINTGFQYNHRREYEHFHEHYEGQAAPQMDDDIAVDFKLKTYSMNARLFLDENKTWTKAIGANVQYQQNKVGGFEYFLPEYSNISGGLSFVNTFKPSTEWIFTAGVRYDIGHMDITGFYDKTLAAHLEEEGHDAAVIGQYAQRSYDVDRNFGNGSASAGFEYRPDANRNLMYKLNIGKTFRFPSANELASNGVHHAAFRYEIGNPDLKAENGYTLDLGINYKNKNGFSAEFTPFLSYYSNFIYLEPVKEIAVDLYHEKPYRYSQAKAIFGGAEYNISWLFLNNFQLSSMGSLVINENLDDDKPLPYTPPFMMTNEAKYLKNTGKKKGLTYYQFSISHQLYAKQSRVGYDEEKTDGTNLFHLGTGFDYRFNRRFAVNMNLQVQNIFNTRYLNHMSLYRRLNIPEPGTNIQLFISIPFGG